MTGRRRNRRRIILLSVFVLLLALLIWMGRSVKPLIRQLARAAVENHGQNVINEAVERQLSSGQIDYDSIVLFEKDVSGAVTALRTNMAEVNRLKTQTLAIADTMLLDMNVTEIGLPLGSIFFPTLFSGSGPKLPVKVLYISNSDAVFRNVFSEAGINQTAHQIMMDVVIDLTILTPAGSETVQVVSSVVVAETVIVGTVPQSYISVGEET